MSKQVKNKIKKTDKLIIANRKLALQIKEKEKRAAEFIIAIKELVFQNKKKEKRTAELVIANKELKEMEEAIRNSLKELSDYKYALNESSIVAITDQKGNIKYANGNFCRISKYSAEELIGQDHRILNSGYHPKSYIKDLWTTIANGKIWKGEFCNKAKDGSIYWVDATIVPFLNKHGKPYQYLSIRRDITEQKNAENELAEKEFFLRESQRAGNIGSYKTNFVTGFWQSSETLDSIFGIDKNYDRSIAGWLEIVHPDDKQKLDEYLRLEVIDKRKSFNKEYRILRVNDKQTKWVSGMGDVKFDDRGNITYMIGTIQDITERKKAEQQIEFDSNNLKALINNTNDLMWSVDKEHKLITSNESFRNMVKLMSGKTITKGSDILATGFSEEQLNRFSKYYERAFSGESFTEIVYMDIPDDLWSEISFYPIYTENAIVGTACFSRDITNRKKAEELLFISQQRYKNLLDNMNDGFIVDDVSDKITFANKKFIEIYGFTKNDVSNIVIEDYVAPEYCKPLRDRHSRRLAGKKVPDVFEYEGIRKDGQRIWLEIHDNPIIENGIATSMQSIIRDITETKKARIALSESEETFRRLFNESADPILIIEDTGFTDCNQSAISILGYSSMQEILNKKPWDISPEKQPDGRLSSEKAEAMIAKAVQQGYNRFEWMHTKSDGTEFPVEVTLTPIIFKGKQLVYVMWRDITERKKAEEKIRESNERYEFVNKATQDTIWEWDYITNEGHWGEGIIQTFGYSENKTKYGENWRDEYVHPSDKEEVSRKLHTCIESGIDNWQQEYRFRCADGSYKYVYDRGFILYDEQAKPYRMIGAMTDVTEKKRLERELVEMIVKKQKLITEITIQAQEKERNELGRELHDNINQILATIKMYLGMAKAKENIDVVLVGKSYEYINEAIKEIRKLSHSLVAPSLGDIGLHEALKELTDEINISNNMQVQLIVEENNGQRLDKKMELMLYRIVQEQMNNIIKYAQAKKAVISLKKDGNTLYLTISDKGVGFDTTKTAKGIGLKNIHSRVEFYSGKMNIISAPGQGCTLKIDFPINNQIEPL